VRGRRPRTERPRLAVQPDAAGSWREIAGSRPEAKTLPALPRRSDFDLVEPSDLREIVGTEAQRVLLPEIGRDLRRPDGNLWLCARKVGDAACVFAEALEQTGI